MPGLDLPRSRSLAIAISLVAIASLGACHHTAALAVDAMAAVDASEAPVTAPPSDAGADVRPSDEPTRDTAAEAAAGQLPDGSPQPPGPLCSSTLPPAPFGLGFSDRLPETSARISEVGPTGLILAFASGATLRFSWQGPTLGFTVGETVRLERVCRSPQLSFPCWDVVRGTGAVAAAWQETGSSEGRAAAPIALPGAPTITLGSGCVYQVTSSTCRFAPAVWANVFQLHADWQGSKTSLAAGATGAAGPWRVTNVVATAAPPLQTMTCIQDGGFAVMVTALGPP